MDDCGTPLTALVLLSRDLNTPMRTPAHQRACQAVGLGLSRRAHLQPPSRLPFLAKLNYLFRTFKSPLFLFRTATTSNKDQDERANTTNLRDANLVEEGPDDADQVPKAEVAVGDHPFHLPRRTRVFRSFTCPCALTRRSGRQA